MNFKLYLLLLLNILFVVDGLAVDKTWTGASSTNWNVAGNWSPAGVPTSSDYVYINDVTNDPVIFSGTTALVKSISQSQGSSLVVNSGAILTINPVISGVAHALDRATFTNNGTTRVESSSGGSVSGVTAFDVTASTFTNNGVLVLNVGFSGFLPFGASASTITNGTGATMSFLDGVGFKCTGGNPANINNQGTINYSGPYFAIDLSTSGSSFTNTETGIVTISSGSGINVATGATFSNLSCGKITAISLENFGTVSNSGFLNVLYAITNSRTFTNTNTGVLKYGSVTGTITKNSGSVIVNDNPTNNTIFSYAGTFTGAVNGIYTNAAATTSAGTFTAPNTFIPLGLSLGEQTLYAKITPSEEGCTYIVPFTYTYVNPPNFTTSPTTKSVCSGSSTTFTVAASNAASYQWQVNTGGSFTNLSNTTPYSGVTNTTLNISNIAGLNGYQYRCVATGPGGSTNSSSATITVITVTVANPATTLVTQGTAFSQPFTASGGTTPYSFSLASGSLPAGLSLNTTTGVVSGTPTVSGNFPVTVRSTDANGCSGTSATYTLVVNSSGPTIIGFTTLDNTVCVGSSATFTATVGNVTGTYTFTLTNGVNTPVTGTRSGAAFSQNITAAGAGTQSFTLIVNDDSQSVRAATELTVSPLPVVSLSNSGPLSCTNTSVTLTAAGGTSYTFTRGGVVVGTAGSSSTAEVNESGTYTVRVANASGCVSTTTTTVTSNTAVVTVTNPFTRSGTVNVLFNQTFSASGGATPRIFSMASGTLPDGLSLSATGVLSGTPTQGGSFTITIRATDANGCVGTGAAYVLTIVDNTPIIEDFAAVNPTVCVGSLATFTATVGNITGTYTFTLTNGVNTPITGTRSGASFSQNLTAAGTGTQSFTLIVSDNSQSFRAATSLTVSSLPTPALTASNNGTLTCAFTSLTLSANGGNTYAFARIGGGGIVSTSPTDGTAVINATGVYSVTVTSAAGCTATTTTTIASNTAAPIATISTTGTEITCAVTSITLTASGGGTYRWENNSTSAIRPVSTAATYSVTVTGGNGCTAMASVSVSANQSLPTVSISSSSTTLSSASPTASLTANGTGNVRWSTGETTQVISVSATGTYSVTLTTGSCSATATASVEFIGGGDLTPILSLPQGNFAASGPESIHNMTMTLSEQAGKSTSGVIVLTLTAPLGYSLSFDPTLTSINVTGGTTNPVAVNNATWEVRTSTSLQLTLVSKTGQRIGPRSVSVIGLSLSRSPVASAGTANLTVNVNDDPTGQYDSNSANNIYARILNSL